MPYSPQILRFQKRMEALPQALLNELLPVQRKNADELADGIRELAERHSITGELIESIAVTAPGESTPAHSLGGTRKAGLLQFIVSVGNTIVRYAAHVEFGTVHAAPHPFFWPVVRLLRKRQRNRINRAARQFFKNWSAR